MIDDRTGMIDDRTGMIDDRTGLLSPEGRVVMISGANRGFGLAIAKRLHADGYRLSLGARRLEALKDAVAPFADERVLQCRFDAEDAPTARTWVDATVRHFGRLDGLVNNAGILRLHDLEDYDEAAFDAMLEVNLKAPYRLTVAALPHLRKSGAGRIVNINSRSGLRYVAGSADYNISKFAGIALNHGPRVEYWADGVRTTAVCPGPSATEMNAVAAGRDLTRPETIATIVSLVIALPNNASVPILPVCSDLEAGV
jgi:NAD(P)-dependent dehydrogenase (short-subunit alcohol dehydrogenase family)